MATFHQKPAPDASLNCKCLICFGIFDSGVYLDRCLHRFCFRCIQEWSKKKAECPFCKQPFFTIFLTTRAGSDFQEYVPRPSEDSSSASPDGYTTLTGGRHAGSSPSKRVLSPPANGILSEGLSNDPVGQRDGEIQQMMRRQVSTEGRPMRQIQEKDMINFRRALYWAGVHISSVQDSGHYQDISAEFFRCNPTFLLRLIPWLKRELTVLFGGDESLVYHVQSLIKNNVTMYDLGSQAFADDLKPFLMNWTEHFLHEFIFFARCPFGLESYDQHANYDCLALLYDEGSHSDLPIITISPDTSCSQGPNNSLSVANLGQAPWDDETPGPSCVISEDVRMPVPSSLATSGSSHEDCGSKSERTKLQNLLQADADSNEGDFYLHSSVVVRYAKSLAEKTAEMVELPLDSEESIRDEKREDRKQIHCHHRSESEPSTSSLPLSWSCSPGSGTVCSRWNHRLFRKGKSRSPQPCSWNSQGSHGHRSKRSKHRSESSGRRLRDCDTRGSLKSQRSPSCERSPSRRASRSQSPGRGHVKRRSRSRDRDHYYVREPYQSSCHGGYACCSQKVYGDDYESSSRGRTQSDAHYSRQSASPEHRIQSSVERTDPQSQRGIHERHYISSERCRSRSPSGGTNRMKDEKPCGKRKCKTRHLENALMGSTSLERENDPQKTFSKCSDC